jgi:hypothetical protein
MVGVLLSDPVVWPDSSDGTDDGLAADRIELWNKFDIVSVLIATSAYIEDAAVCRKSFTLPTIRCVLTDDFTWMVDFWFFDFLKIRILIQIILVMDTTLYTIHIPTKKNPWNVLRFFVFDSLHSVHSKQVVKFVYS